MDEMAESTNIVRQCLDKLERMEGMPWIADDRKVVLPPREELQTSMESLIHHFKIVTEGFRVPEGEIYVAVESPRGESGCYLVSDGGPKPWRIPFRAPSFAARERTAPAGREGAVGRLESEPGIHAGEPTPDGEITLRAVECLGGCGYATVVAVDDRYHHNVRAETVPQLLGGIDGGT